MELFQASQQWSTRPADQRFSSLDELHAAVNGYRATAKQSTVQYADLRVEADAGEIILKGKSERPAKMTHWSFGQLAGRVGAPAGYLRDLPATLAAQNINHGLANISRHDGEREAKLLLHDNGSYLVRAFTSDRYTRIWNGDVTSRLIRLTQERPEWQPAPAAFDGSRGLYASDRDMFVFLVDNGRRIFERGPGGGLSRGFFASNNEVGGGTFTLCRFMYEYVCGNHIVWGAKDVQEIRLRHVGQANARADRELRYELAKYAEGSAAEDEARITRAQGTIIGKSKDEVLDTVFGLGGKKLGAQAAGVLTDAVPMTDDDVVKDEQEWAQGAWEREAKAARIWSKVLRNEADPAIVAAIKDRVRKAYEERLAARLERHHELLAELEGLEAKR